MLITNWFKLLKGSNLLNLINYWNQIRFLKTHWKNGPVRRHTQTHQKSKLSKWATIVQLINCLWNTPRGGPRRGPRRWVVRDLVSLSIWITVAVWWFNYSFRAVFFDPTNSGHALPQKNSMKVNFIHIISVIHDAEKLSNVLIDLNTFLNIFFST